MKTVAIRDPEVIAMLEGAVKVIEPRTNPTALATSIIRREFARRAPQRRKRAKP